MCCFCFCFRLEATYLTGILIRLCALQPGPGASRLLQPGAPYSTYMDSEDGFVQTLTRGRAAICCPSGCHKGCLNGSNTHTRVLHKARPKPGFLGGPRGRGRPTRGPAPHCVHLTHCLTQAAVLRKRRGPPGGGRRANGKENTSYCLLPTKQGHFLLTSSRKK